MTSRIPPLLEPYLTLPPEASLILLTSVLGASTNWLVLRYMYSALAATSTAGAQQGTRREAERAISEGKRSENQEDEEGEEGGAKVVLVSFLRDLSFWREGSIRMGLDLSRLAARKRFAFVDGLSGLFLPGQGPGVDGEAVLRSTEPGSVYADIMAVVQSLQGGGGEGRRGKVLLVVDALDLLLATGGLNTNPVKLGDMLMDLREHVHATVLTISNDSPLVLRQQTPLEINHVSFLLSFAHQAYLTVSLRLLDTGTARDVSGIIRIGVGEAEASKGDLQVEAKELLYFVGGDGNVKVFERGQ